MLIWNIDAGLFGNLNFAMNSLYRGMAETNTTAARVEWFRQERSVDFSYGPVGVNLWDSFFEPLAFSDCPEPVIRTPGHLVADPLGGQWMYHTYKCVPDWRQTFNALYARHIRIRPAVRERLDAIRASRFAGRRVLGVHARGQGISGENMFNVPRPDYWISRTRDAMRDLSADAVFLASDSSVMVDAYSAAFGDRLITQDNVHRGTARGEIHRYFKQDGYELGVQVILDCLLLASSVGLLHVTSNVATAAGYINPTMPMIYCETPLRAKIATAFVRRFGRPGITRWSQVRMARRIIGRELAYMKTRRKRKA
ncbi:MAG: hypothetical protein ABL879_00685 [Devosia sp.]